MQQKLHMVLGFGSLIHGFINSTYTVKKGEEWLWLLKPWGGNPQKHIIHEYDQEIVGIVYPWRWQPVKGLATQINASNNKCCWPPKFVTN